MTRKHFVSIAAGLHAVKPKDEQLLNQWRKDVSAITRQLTLLNDRFDESRFIKACEEGS